MMVGLGGYWGWRLEEISRRAGRGGAGEMANAFSLSMMDVGCGYFVELADFHHRIDAESGHVPFKLHD